MKTSLDVSALRRSLLAAAALSPLLPVAAQQVFPWRPVQIVVPYPPGGLTDAIARGVALGLTARWKQPVVIENKGGGGTTIGTAFVARAPADGHTLLFTSTGYVTNLVLMKSLPYKSDQFTPIAMAATAPNVLYVHPSVPAKDLQELVAYAKAHPDAMKFASTGNGSSSHLTAELFAAKAGISMVHVPYKGAGPALSDMLAGHVNAIFHFPSSLNLVKEGRLRAIAVAGAERLREAPQLPTMAEGGVPGVVSASWFGFLLPAATPQAVKDKVHRDITEVLASPAMKTLLEESAMAPSHMSQEEFAHFLAGEKDKWAGVAAQRSISLE